ncbi:MAG: heavy metal-binding domain-containing protein [Solirubrobacteraceae bacterium]|jgi:uncharacterized protein YbjQ (UPF0145 family)
MGFFDAAGQDDADPGQGDDGADERESLARIEAGGIPADAERRLQGLGHEGSLFTSALSVNEFALLGRLGTRPLAQVMGASVHHVGWQYLPLPAGYQSSPSLSIGGATLGGGLNDTIVSELAMITQAWNQARRRALDRLTEEARIVGADAVLGVRLERGEHDWASGSVDYLISGTAVRFPGTEPPNWPLLTDVSVQDYWALYQAGYDSLGLVATSAVVFVSPSTGTRLRRAATVTKNQELEEITRGVFTARDTARARLLGQARDASADGVVGMAFEQTMREESFKFEGYGLRGSGAGRFNPMTNTYDSGAADIPERSGYVITFHAAGTAVRLGVNEPRYPPETVMRLEGVT